MKIEIDVEQIYGSKELRIMRDNLGIRDDWHEPDEQGITALVVGEKFDNAGTGDEMKVLISKEGKPIFAINLATLFAFATERKEEPK